MSDRDPGRASMLEQVATIRRANRRLRPAILVAPPVTVDDVLGNTAIGAPFRRLIPDAFYFGWVPR